MHPSAAKPEKLVALYVESPLRCAPAEQLARQHAERDPHTRTRMICCVAGQAISPLLPTGWSTPDTVIIDGHSSVSLEASLSASLLAEHLPPPWSVYHGQGSTMSAVIWRDDHNALRQMGLEPCSFLCDKAYCAYASAARWCRPESLKSIVFSGNSSCGLQRLRQLEPVVKQPVSVQLEEAGCTRSPRLVCPFDVPTFVIVSPAHSSRKSRLLSQLSRLGCSSVRVVQAIDGGNVSELLVWSNLKRGNQQWRRSINWNAPRFSSPMLPPTPREFAATLSHLRAVRTALSALRWQRQQQQRQPAQTVVPCCLHLSAALILEDDAGLDALPYWEVSRMSDWLARARLPASAWHAVQLGAYLPMSQTWQMHVRSAWSNGKLASLMPPHSQQQFAMGAFATLYSYEGLQRLELLYMPRRDGVSSDAATFQFHMPGQRASFVEPLLLRRPSVKPAPLGLWIAVPPLFVHGSDGLVANGSKSTIQRNEQLGVMMYNLRSRIAAIEIMRHTWCLPAPQRRNMTSWKAWPLPDVCSHIRVSE
mmetsp:Transcript_71406/g.118656  ORF Transcript_71406/g.118656 Transcript_71406/m.118656 type:complete len:534 (+) Transcript_71406:312-1913(+)